MEVRHNTSLLERAVELSVQRAAIPTQQAEADAFQKKVRAAALRRLYTGIAVGVAALGVGLGVMFGLWRPPVATQAYVQTLPLRESSPPVPDRKPEVPARPFTTQPSEPFRPPTVDYTKFARQKVTFLGRTWVLEAGHHYDSDKDPTWKRAWCYTVVTADSVSVTVSLGARSSPQDLPEAPGATAETLAKAGLDDPAAIALTTKCPWLDGRVFTTAEIRPTRPLKAGAFGAEPTFEQKGRTLVFRGTILSNFADELRRRSFDRLQITSNGGLLVHAMSAGDWLRDNKKEVEAFESCLSACTLVLAGGTSRLAHPDAKIGIHRFYSKDEQPRINDLEIGQQLSSVILKYIDRNGVDQRFFHRMAEVPSEDMAYIDHATLRSWRLLTPEPTVAPASPASPIPQPAPPPSTTFSFEKRDGYDAIGYDFADGEITAIPDQASCENRCSQNKYCYTYTFRKDKGLCYLKSNSEILVKNRNAQSGFRGPKPEESQLSVGAGFIYTGAELRNVSNDTIEGCVRRCHKDPACQAFNFEPGTGCTLLSKVSGNDRRPGATAGVKN